MTPRHSAPRELTFLDRLLLALLLRLYPRPFSEEHRKEWLAFAHQQRMETRYRMPLLGWLRFWMDIVRDLAVSLPRVRRDAFPQPARHPGRPGRANPVDSLRQDLRFALRTLFRRPLFPAVAILTLGLGIGAATAMFSVVDGVLLAGRQYRDPDRLVSIWQGIHGRKGYTDEGETRLEYAEYRALQEASTSFESVSVYAAAWGKTTLSGGPTPELVRVGAATASLLPVLGVTPALGRWFLPEEEGEDVGDKAMVTVLSHDTWTRRFAGDPSVLGHTVILNGRSYTVVGVLPPGFRMQWLSASLVRADDPGPRDFWVPVGAPEWVPSRGSTMWEAVGRLLPGVTLERARSETSAILANTWKWGHSYAVLVPRVDDEARGISSPLLLLFGATGLLLLIACGNVAALFLGEMRGRVHEVATRSAIGADRRRIVRQLLTESLVLGLSGSALGALLAVAGTEALVSLAPPIPRMELVRVDLTALAFAAGLGTLSGVLFGVAPAFLTARQAVGTALRSGGRAGSRRKAGMGRWMLAGEIALTVVLLVASGLLARSLSHLLDIAPGFKPASLAEVAVDLPIDRYKGSRELNTLMKEVLVNMQSVPGATAVSAANALPFPGNASTWGVRLHPEDSTYLMSVGYHVAPGYLRFMGIPILEGRGVMGSDDADSPPVVVVSESLAKALWGDRSPVGQDMTYPKGTVTVVGVAGDVRQTALQDAPAATFYVPFAQHARWRLSFVVHSDAPGSAVFPAMRAALWQVDNDLAITRSGYLSDAIKDSAAEERYRAMLMTVFAVLATVLAAVGITGVTARHVAHQTREMGIRKALGAEDGILLGSVVGDAALTGVVGVGAGLLGAFWLRPVLAAFLFGVKGFDVPIYAGVAIIFLGLSTLASYLPARRLLRVDPVMVLKEE